MKLVSINTENLCYFLVSVLIQHLTHNLLFLFSPQIEMPKKSKAKNTKRQSGDSEQPPNKKNRVKHSVTPSPLCFHSPVSLFESLIQPMAKEQFFSEYWEKKPLHLQRSDCSTASYYKSLFQLSDLQSLCSQGLDYYRDINVVRCISGTKKVLNKGDRVKNSVLNKNLVRDKATIQFHQPQRFKVRPLPVKRSLSIYCLLGQIMLLLMSIYQFVKVYGTSPIIL